MSSDKGRWLRSWVMENHFKPEGQVPGIGVELVLRDEEEGVVPLRSLQEKFKALVSLKFHKDYPSLADSVGYIAGLGVPQDPAATKKVIRQYIDHVGFNALLASFSQENRIPSVLTRVADPDDIIELILRQVELGKFSEYR